MMKSKKASEDAAEVTQDQRDQLDNLHRRIQSLERDFEEQPRSIDSELIHKLMHACLRSEYISEEEELEILKYLMDD